MLTWIDTEDIAIALENKYPNHDILQTRFTALRAMIISLEEFDDDIHSSNEKKLEAIQMAWLDERD